jgi:hypothetical protein
MKGEHIPASSAWAGAPAEPRAAPRQIIAKSAA